MPMSFTLHHARPTWRATRRGGLSMLMLLASAWLGATVAFSAVPVSKEYQIKAAFLYNFTKFITWPPQEPATGKQDFVIGVLGKNPFGSELENVARGRHVAGRQLIIRSVNTLEEALTVNLLFVPADEAARLGSAMDSLHQASVLTVGETARFAELGGIITFSMAGDKIRFEINRSNGQRARLRISPQLLKLAISERQGKS